MTDNSAFDDLFSGAPLMAILRGMGVEKSLALAMTAWDLGIDSVELPIQTPEDLEALRVVAEEGAKRNKTVGAGTVVTHQNIIDAAAAGAAYTVSPGFDIDLVRASADAGLPPLPGVATPSEVQLAMREGLTWLKAFPASVLGTAWVRAMHGPFPGAKFVATGGIHALNAEEFLDAGVCVVAVGAALADERQLPRLAELVRRSQVSGVGLCGGSAKSADSA